jgi:hypothetical protein
VRAPSPDTYVEPSCVAKEPHTPCGPRCRKSPTHLMIHDQALDTLFHPPPPQTVVRALVITVDHSRHVAVSNFMPGVIHSFIACLRSDRYTWKPRHRQAKPCVRESSDCLTNTVGLRTRLDPLAWHCVKGLIHSGCCLNADALFLTLLIFDFP